MMLTIVVFIIHQNVNHSRFGLEKYSNGGKHLLLTRNPSQFPVLDSEWLITASPSPSTGLQRHSTHVSTYTYAHIIKNKTKFKKYLMQEEIFVIFNEPTYSPHFLQSLCSFSRIHLRHPFHNFGLLLFNKTLKCCSHVHGRGAIH